MAKKSNNVDVQASLTPILQAGRDVSVSELAQELISECGGAKEFAKLYIREMKTGTKDGSVARARMLDGVLKIVTSASSQTKGTSKPEDQMSEEELAAEAERLLVKGGARTSSREAGPSAPPGRAECGPDHGG